jgi:hypothetical protein
MGDAGTDKARPSRVAIQPDAARSPGVAQGEAAPESTCYNFVFPVA